MTALTLTPAQLTALEAALQNHIEQARAANVATPTRGLLHDHINTILDIVRELQPKPKPETFTSGLHNFLSCDHPLRAK